MPMMQWSKCVPKQNKNVLMNNRWIHCNKQVGQSQKWINEKTDSSTTKWPTLWNQRTEQGSHKQEREREREREWPMSVTSVRNVQNSHRKDVTVHYGTGVLQKAGRPTARVPGARASQQSSLPVPELPATLRWASLKHRQEDKPRDMHVPFSQSQIVWLYAVKVVHPICLDIIV